MRRQKRIRRSPDIHLYIRDGAIPDIAGLLRGLVNLELASRIVAVNQRTQEEHILTEVELLALARIRSCRWSGLDDLIRSRVADLETLENLVEKGLLLVEPTDGSGQEPRDPTLETMGWNSSGATYQIMSRWLEPVRGRVDTSESGEFSMYQTDDLFEHLIVRHGAPPNEFHSVDYLGEMIALPINEKVGGLYDNLRQRETVRKYDGQNSVTLDDASTLLRYTFGCRGTMKLADRLVVLKKCSPSGGALHPVEAYPLVLNVDGVPTGLYHYNVEHHSLGLIEELDEAAARDLAVDITAGQEWYGLAHMLIILTARFDRFFWKYRNNSKGYKVLFLDAGHLSQTFYLLCTELGLGPFFTAAIKDSTIEKRLGLEDYREGAIGICGCGVKGDVAAWRFDYESYLPHRQSG